MLSYYYLLNYYFHINTICSINYLLDNITLTRLFINNNYLILPLYSIIKILLLSYDVIHSLGYYSLGIKFDAIPGRINVSQSIRPLLTGEHSGFCFELCGQGHSSMLLSLIIL